MIEALRGPLKLFESTAKCPVCGGESLEVSVYMYFIPYFGNIVMYIYSCGNCGFKSSNVGVLEEGKPKRVIVRVRGEKELRYIVVKPAKASIRIPEVSLEYTPGPYSTGYITTIEGILHEFQEAASIACQHAETPECPKILDWLKRAIEGSVEFTLEMCDYEGTGKIAGEEVVETDVNECGRAES
ncbi:MAG: ZPR1 zinc finger domain-containing protein [Thermoprotei archaeon]|nr:ZPR1 zinc finger domain-containing protein [Thermoprotei archaeon]